MNSFYNHILQKTGATTCFINCMLCCVFFCSYTTYSQDIHFSQYNGSVLNLNPAFTGFFDGDYRINAIYRSQWTSVPVPYRTISIAADGRFKTKKMKSDCFGLGIYFNNDKAGDTYYNTTQLYLSGSYIPAVTPVVQRNVESLFIL